MEIPAATIYSWKVRDWKRGEDWDKEREAMQDESAIAVKQTLKAALQSLRALLKEMITELRSSARSILACSHTRCISVSDRT
jgi:hypothetical protein